MIYPRENPENVGSNNGKILAHLYFDTMEDYTDLPGLDKVAPGSDAMCIETSAVYILRRDTGAWKGI